MPQTTARVHSEEGNGFGEREGKRDEGEGEEATATARHPTLYNADESGGRRLTSGASAPYGASPPARRQSKVGGGDAWASSGGVASSRLTATSFLRDGGLKLR